MLAGVSLTWYTWLEQGRRINASDDVLLAIGRALRLDDAGLDRAFELHAEAYARIFERCGIESIPVEASSGAMGGSESVEFMALSDAGEDWIARCSGCGYRANLEKARSALEAAADPDEVPEPERFATPGVRTIEALTTFEGGARAERQIKTLVYLVEDEPTLLLLDDDGVLTAYR